MIGDNRKERFCKSIGKFHSICTEQFRHTHKKTAEGENVLGCM